MFHRYVTASSGRRVDFDRASYLMDKELLRRARAEVSEKLDSINDPNGFDMACDRSYPKDQQSLPWSENALIDEIWEKYCHYHRNRYRSSFEPDVSPSWDA